MEGFFMRRSALLRAIVPSAIIFASVVLAGCGSDSTSTTTPSTVTTTDSFSATIGQSGEAVQAFTVSAKGTVTVALTAVAPLSTMSLGVGLGAWDGTNCGTSFATNKDARAGSTALTGTAAQGSYCIRVYDSGNVPTDYSVTYTIQVVHP
jgi:hypothetical protein